MLRVQAALLPLVLLAALLAVACAESEPKLNQNQAKFKAHVLQVLKKEKAILTPLLVNSPDPGKALEANIDDQFATAIAHGRPLQHDLAVLDSKATVLAWRSPDPEDLTQTYLGYIGQNYSHFKKMDLVYSKEKIAAFEVFTQYGPGFGICAPMTHGGKLVGALCLGYDFDTMVKTHGLNKDQLLAINFNR